MAVRRISSRHCASAFVFALIASAVSPSQARGVSPYLPLNLAPEIERQIERVLILADMPVMSRPIAAATVLDALPVACQKDAALCGSVRRYLDRYMKRIGLTDASVEVAAVDGTAAPLPNEHGMSSDSAWRASVRGFWQPSDYAIVSLGGIAYEDDAVPSGSLLSLGFEYAQLDIGYRDRWYSPFTDSSMLISAQAQTLPSITLSNYQPITSFGLRYEIFIAEMESSDRIVFGEGFTSGQPRLGGMRVSIEPAAGWSLSANRLLQYGGGERDGSFTDFLRALWRPRQFDNRSDTLGQDEEFGNQLAAWTSRFIFPGATPFAAYLEYAGEDTSYSGNYRLGNSALSMGLHFPRLWRRFDVTLEMSEWQNGWYVNSLYGDGLSEGRRVLGHWGADQRVFGDAVGAQTHMVRVGWEPRFGGLIQFCARTIANEDYSGIDYQRGYDVTVSYSRAVRGFSAGAEVIAGRDVFGDGFSRLAGFVRFGEEWEIGSVDSGWQEAVRPRGAELFVDTGVNASRVTLRRGDGSPKDNTSIDLSPHIGIGARRAVSERSDLGVRAEIDRIENELLLSVRALDYRYRFGGRLALSAFVGAARYDVETPAYGYYLGIGAQWRNLIPGFDLGLDLRYADKVARDKLLPGDPVSTPRPDLFYDMAAATLSLSYRY